MDVQNISVYIKCTSKCIKCQDASLSPAQYLAASCVSDPPLSLPSSVFGSQLDIHSGGVDLAFPHHENEVAQSEAYHRCPQWGNYFLHSGGGRPY